MFKFFKVLVCLSFIQISAQDYTSYFIGNSSDIVTNPQFGVCLMGGSSENDQAMQWFLNRVDGGDVVILRATGSDGYNDYFYNQLGVSINSVETLIINNINGALDPYVLQKVSQAEGIWFAGGDQADYINFFKNNAMKAILNDHINVKNYPIGGISAGMAIMGEFYFDALNGTVTSNQALNNPYDSRVSLGISDFLSHPLLENVITDTHYDNPNREGRHIAFLARLQSMTGERIFGIGLDEFTSACVDENGIAHIYGEFPTYNDFAYFIQINCVPNNTPENLTPNQNLNWNNNQEAIKAYKVPGVVNGTNQFNLNTWEEGIGGEWQNWWVDQGNYQFQNSSPVDCDNLDTSSFEKNSIRYYPNPVIDILQLEHDSVLRDVDIFDINGKLIFQIETNSKTTDIDLSSVSKGIYFVIVSLDEGQSVVIKIKKQ